MKQRYYKVAVSYLVEVEAATDEEARQKVNDGDGVMVHWHTAQGVGIIDYWDEEVELD